jgi:hypothetical protein
MTSGPGGSCFFKLPAVGESRLRDRLHLRQQNLRRRQVGRHHDLPRARDDRIPGANVIKLFLSVMYGFSY